MRYNKIRKMDISNGPGVRVSVFMQGCEFHCPECFNKETWDFDGGEEFTDTQVEEVLNLCSKSHIQGLSILGGEPMHPNNIKGTEKLAKAFKERFPQKNIWVWSGFKYEDYLSKQEALKYIDVIVDGQFVNELHNPKLCFKGSSNQRTIDVQKSLEKGEVVLLED